jgi:secreted trypsin-like serine protease
MTILISTGRVAFHDFTCLVFQCDSGGPLVYLEKDSKYTQAGIALFLSRCSCDSGYPAGFAKVTSYLSWISAKTGIAIV